MNAYELYLYIAGVVLAVMVLWVVDIRRTSAQKAAEDDEEIDSRWYVTKKPSKAKRGRKA